MKKILILLLFQLSASALFSQSQELIDIRSFLEDIQALKAYYPSDEGTANESKTADYIMKKIGSWGISYTQRSFANSESHHSFSQCIDAVIKGKNAESVFIVLPINNVIERTNHPGILVNVALGLFLLEQMKSRVPLVTLHFLFLGAEYGSTQEYPIGSQIFLDDFIPDTSSLFLYLNFQDIPRRIIIQGAGNGIVAPYWLINDCSQALGKTGLSFLLRGNKNQLFRMEFSDEKTMAEPYLKAEYPTIVFSGEYAKLAENERDSWLRSFDKFFEIFVSYFDKGFPKEWDKHYLFFQFFNSSIVINEYVLVLGIVLVLLAFIACLLIFSNYFKRLLIIFVDKWWSLLFFMPLTFLFSLLGTLILDLILSLRGDPNFWQTMPFPFFVFKVFLVVLPYLLLAPVIRRLSFPNDSRFYEKWAMLFLLADVVVFSIINISFAYYFVWAFFFVALSIFFTDRAIKFILYAISPFWLIKLLIDFFIVIPEYRFCRALLSNLIVGNVILALSLTPFILLGTSVLMHFGLKLKKIRQESLISAMIYSIAFISAFTISVLVLPGHTRDYPQIVTVHNSIDMSEKSDKIEISSDFPLHDIAIWDADEYYTFNTHSKRYTIPRPYVSDLMDVSTTTTYFLSRKNVSVVIANKGIPYEVHCIIKSSKEFTLYDSTFPFVKQKDGVSYSLTIGANPPSPLIVEVTVPADTDMVCDVDVTYRDFPFRFVVSGLYKEIKTLLTVKNRISIDK
jgi:hypothetical protein